MGMVWFSTHLQGNDQDVMWPRRTGRSKNDGDVATTETSDPTSISFSFLITRACTGHSRFISVLGKCTRTVVVPSLSNLPPLIVHKVSVNHPYVYNLFQITINNIFSA